MERHKVTNISRFTHSLLHFFGGRNKPIVPKAYDQMTVSTRSRGNPYTSNQLKHTLSGYPHMTHLSVFTEAPYSLIYACLTHPFTRTLHDYNHAPCTIINTHPALLNMRSLSLYDSSTQVQRMEEKERVEYSFRRVPQPQNRCDSDQPCHSERGYRDTASVQNSAGYYTTKQGLCMQLPHTEPSLFY